MSYILSESLSFSGIKIKTSLWDSKANITGSIDSGSEVGIWENVINKYGAHSGLLGTTRVWKGWTHRFYYLVYRRR